MKLRGIPLLTLVWLLCIQKIYTGKGKSRHHDDDDDDDHDRYDDDDSYDDDDDGVPRYCPKKDGMFPNPTDCTMYYNCVNGQPFVMACAPGLLFDPKSKRCNFPDQVKCKNECRGRDGLFPSQHRCDEFVLCTGNKAKKYRCKKGLYFDVNLNVCNYKDQVICQIPGMYSKPYKSGKGKRRKKNKNYDDDDHDHDNYNIHDDDDDDHHSNKRKSRKHRGESHVYMSKGGDNGVEYNINRSGSDEADDREDDSKVEVGQKYKAAPDDGVFYESDHKVMRKAQLELATASVRSVCPKARGIFPHAEYCHMFYRCFDGEVLMKTCPAGLLFHEKKHTCLYPKEVKCGNRKVPVDHMTDSHQD